MKPKVLFNFINDNLGGSIERELTRSVEVTVAQTETYENSAEVSITFGAEWSAGVPLVAE